MSKSFLFLKSFATFKTVKFESIVQSKICKQMFLFYLGLGGGGGEKDVYQLKTKLK